MLERAARHTEGWASSPWEAASGQQRRRRTARRAPSVAALGWWARRAAARPCVSALGAPRVAIPKELAEECLRGGSAPPNGSRLICGANAGGRKPPDLRYELVGAQTHASPETRPRQLQALVRHPG